MSSDLLRRRRITFVLWRCDAQPALVIGTFSAAGLAGERRVPFAPAQGVAGLWTLDPNGDLGLTDGIYHYFFEIDDTRPGVLPGQRLRVADPTAWCVDWRLCSAAPVPTQVPYERPDLEPACVIGYDSATRTLQEVDPDGRSPDWSRDASPGTLPTNDRLVVYELPTRWARSDTTAGTPDDIGTFQDVQALVDPAASPANFGGVTVLEPPAAYLRTLGINAIELTPIADSRQQFEWGYGTSNYHAPDFDIGYPRGASYPTALHDYTSLCVACHDAGIRLGYDAVMSFALGEPYRWISYMDFHVDQNQSPPDPESYGRGAFGGDLWKLNYLSAPGYRPTNGQSDPLYPAREFHQIALDRWVRELRSDFVRFDSVNNYAAPQWGVAAELSAGAHAAFEDRCAAAGVPASAQRFFTVGEWISFPVPVDKLVPSACDALWTDWFLIAVRHVILGTNTVNEPSFEWTVRKLVDPRIQRAEYSGQFTAGTQVVNYVTSHDVGGSALDVPKARLRNYLSDNGFSDDTAAAKRIKLAFVCLLTAIGIPMILAGEEFGDIHDIQITGNPPDSPDFEKQVDPVNWSRLNDPWRLDLQRYVGRLIQLRATNDALAADDVSFLHSDFNEGKRVMAWQRGQLQDDGSGDVVVVVANFSDWGTSDPTNPASEYVVPGWPPTSPGRSWFEASQARAVPDIWIGREPLYPWEAKVYVLI